MKLLILLLPTPKDCLIFSSESPEALPSYNNLLFVNKFIFYFFFYYFAYCFLHAVLQSIDIGTYNSTMKTQFVHTKKRKVGSNIHS